MFPSPGTHTTVMSVLSPVLHPRSDDGFVELGDLPLQHGPQALSQAVVVLLQLLLVLFLVRRDQVLVLLNRLPAPVGPGRIRELPDLSAQCNTLCTHQSS